MLPPPLGARDGVDQAIVEQGSVGQPRQRVMHGQVSYPFFRRLSLGDVDGGAHGADDAAGRVPYRRGADKFVVVGPVVEPDPDLRVADHLAACRALQGQLLGPRGLAVLIDLKMLWALPLGRHQRQVVRRCQAKAGSRRTVAGDAPSLLVMSEPDR